MLDCLILGDSLAVGVGQARAACQTVAQVGVTSGAWLQSLLPTTPRVAGSVVISLGVNDDPTMDTLSNLRRVRRAVTAAKVTWLLPGLKEAVRKHIRTVALEHGDRLVDTIGEVGADHLHPGTDGYRRIAAATQEAGPLPQLGPSQLALPQLALRQPPLAQWRPGGPGFATLQGSLYGTWPPVGLAYAALPPRDYAFHAIPSLPRR